MRANHPPPSSAVLSESGLLRVDRPSRRASDPLLLRGSCNDPFRIWEGVEMVYPPDPFSDGIGRVEAPTRPSKEVCRRAVGRVGPSSMMYPLSVQVDANPIGAKPSRGCSSTQNLPLRTDGTHHSDGGSCSGPSAPEAPRKRAPLSCVHRWGALPSSSMAVYATLLTSD